MKPSLPLSEPASSTRPDPRACDACRNGAALEFEFSYAFQPIVDVTTKRIFAHEALIRGVRGESAHTVLSRVNDGNRYKFDQACRVKAITSAAELAVTGLVSINFLPNAIYRPEVCIRTTLDAAKKSGFPLNRIMFETIEGEKLTDAKWFADVLREYKKMGFHTAIDDFGAGYAGLNLLADFQPDVVKLDMDLIRNIDTRRSAQAIVRGAAGICEQLGIKVIAEGVETLDEYLCLQAMGLTLMQGYLFSKPVFEAGTTEQTINWPRYQSGDADAPDASSMELFPAAPLDAVEPPSRTHEGREHGARL